MRKILIAITIISFCLPWLVFAADICYDPFCTTGLIQNRSGLGSVEPTIVMARIINMALSGLGFLSLVLIVYGGARWMLARGNEEEIKKAKDIIVGAVIGMVIVLASYSIAQFVFNNLVNITNAY